ncbi:MAG: ABC transporter permease, partial [Clostridia bacterium]
MTKFKNFFIAIGQWFKQVGKAIGRWFASWFVSIDNKRAKFVSVGLWFKNWFVEVDGKPNHFIQIGRWFKSLFVSMNNEEPKLKTLMKKDGTKSIIASLISILCGILIGFIVMLAINPKAAPFGLVKILFGTFVGGTSSIGDTLYYATPLIMTGLSVGFAFKTGLFNIGAPGQYIFGSFCAIFCALTWQWPWWACVIIAAVGGAIWGFFPGIFKALFNINEVISSIMFNWIGLFLVYGIVSTNEILYNPRTAKTFIIPEVSALPKMGLDKLLPGSNSLNCGIFIAIAVAIIIFIVLNKTVFGFELKACGSNKSASKYAGIKEKRTIVLSMVIAGALAGIGGSLYYLVGGVYGATLSIGLTALPATGFNGIPVALLALSHPLGIILSALFMGALTVGGDMLQPAYEKVLVDVIIGIIIYFAAFAVFIKQLLETQRKKKADKISVGESGKG